MAAAEEPRNDTTIEAEEPNETTIDAELPQTNTNSIIRQLRQIKVAKAFSFLQHEHHRQMLLQELEDRDPLTIEWVWRGVLETNFVVEFLKLSFGCEILLVWIEVANFRNIDLLLRKFQTLWPKQFVEMACARSQHQVVVEFIQRAKRCPDLMSLIITLLNQGERPIFINEWGHLVLTYCLHVWGSEHCGFIFDQISYYFECGIPQLGTKIEKWYMTKMIEICFEVGKPDWVFSICNSVVERPLTFSSHPSGRPIIMNLLDSSHQCAPMLHQLTQEQIGIIKERLIKNLIFDAPSIASKHASHMVVKKCLACTMESDLPTYLTILSAMDTSTTMSGKDYRLEHGIICNPYVKSMVLDAQFQFKNFYVVEMEKNNIHPAQKSIMLAIVVLLIYLGDMTSVNIIDENWFHKFHTK